MTNRLVWNFEFTSPPKHLLADLEKEKEDELKWEARFFWPDSEIIRLKLLDASLLELSHYQHKQKNDLYYLVEQEYNIKNRRDELVYKPLIKKQKYSLGFGSKLNLADAENTARGQLLEEVQTILPQLKKSKQLLVKKESFSYKLATQPSVKLELARIEVDAQIYFSLCVEGKSQQLVEKLSKLLLGKQATEDYVRFLKKITKKS